MPRTRRRFEQDFRDNGVRRASAQGLSMSRSAFLRKALHRRALWWPLVLAVSSLGFAAGPPFALAATQPVPAQQQQSADDGHEHAAEDLAGTSIDQIERQTAVNADRIFHETGRRPGAAEYGASARALSSDPGTSGRWGPVLGTQVVPVFQAVLPSGKVLIWDSVGDNAAETYTNHTFTRAMVWNPADNTYKRVDVQGSNIFCAGFTHLQNGNVLVAGGNKDSSLAGIVQTHIFDWQTETWSRGPDMAAGRWYPSVTEMANGEATVVGGGPSTDEVYQTNGSIRQLTNATDNTYDGRQYPFMNSRPDTQLGLYGPYDLLNTLVTSGNGALTGSGTRDGTMRDYGSFASYDIGKTSSPAAATSARTAWPTSRREPLSFSTQIPDRSRRSRRRVSQHPAPPIQHHRSGRRFGPGHGRRDQRGHIGPRRSRPRGDAAERWDPATGAWTTLASASRVRQYHSTATLLPDGRVLTGGGGVCGVCMNVGYLEKNVEYFTPPYLYAKDGSGNLASRPVISGAPTSIGINANFTITSGQAATVKKVGLVGLSSVTHDVDPGQRYVPLKFTTAGTTLTVTGPPSGGAAPPGYYMLFITDSSGVPSVARMVQVAKGPTPLMSPVKNSAAARCVDVPRSNLASRTYLQVYTCNNTKAQALTRFPADASVRVLGNCLDVPSRHFVAGQRIWAYTCNGTIAQTWAFTTAGTIRPTAASSLCLAASGRTNAASIALAKCSGSSAQKWTW